MPVVGGFIAGALGLGGTAWSVAGFAGFTAGASFAASALGGVAVKLLTSVALSALSAALQEKPKNAAAGIRSTQVMTGGVNPESFILGEYATSGAMPSPPMSHTHGGSCPNGMLTYVIELAGIPGHTLKSVIIDGEEVELGEEAPIGYGRDVSGRFHGRAWMRYYDGTQTAADPTLVQKYPIPAVRPWSVAMVGTGICYAVIHFQYDREVYQGWPQARFVLGGVPLYDPREDSSVGGAGAQRWGLPATYTTSSNVAVQVYNILRGVHFPGGDIFGGDIPPEDVPFDAWALEMDRCDALVEDGDGGTEPQYRAGLEVMADDDPFAVISELQATCAGRVTEDGGVWMMRVGGPRLPVLFINDHDLLADETEEFTPFPDIGEIFNGITATFVDPANQWESTEAPTIYNAAWEAEDDDRRLMASVALPACPYPMQVQRLMLSLIADHRRMRKHILSLPSDALILQALDTISWTSTINSYVSKLFEIMEVERDFRAGRVRIVIREVDADDYDPPTGLTRPSPPDLRPVLPAVQAVPGWSVSAVAVLDAASNNRRPGVLAVWDAGAVADARGLRIAVRLAGDTGDGVERPMQDVRTGKAVIEGLPATAYHLRARLVADRPTEWSGWEAVTTPDVRLGAADIAVEITEAITQAHTDIAAANALIAAEAAARVSADTAGASAAQAALEAQAGAIRDELAEDVRRRVPVEVQTTSELERLAERVTGLMARASATQSRITDAGIYVDAATGKVRIEAISRLDGELGEARIALDALAGSISLFVSKTYVDGAISAAVLDPTQIPIIGDLELRLNTAELALDAANAAITAKADSLTVSAQDTRLTTAESSIDGLNAEVALKASTVALADATARLTTAEATLESLDGAGLSIALTDTNRLSRDAETLAEQNLSDLARGYFAGEAQRQDLAFLRTDMRALVTEDREAIAGLRTELGVAVDDAQAKLILEQEARATADAAEASQRLALSSRLDDVEGTGAGNSTAITALTTRTDAAEGVLVTQANALTSLASELNSPITGLAATRAALSDLATTSATADTALASRAQALEVTVGHASTGLAATRAQMSAADTANASATSAVASRTSTLESTVNSPTTGLPATRAQMSAADTALANATSAVAGRTTALEATTGSLISSVTTQSTVISTLAGNAAATHVLRVRAGGAVGEMEAIAADNVEGSASQISFSFDRVQFLGALQLFGGTLASNDFVAGASGWQIKNDGDAEFNSLVVRSDMILGGAVSRRAYIIGVSPNYQLLENAGDEGSSTYYVLGDPGAQEIPISFVPVTFDDGRPENPVVVTFSYQYTSAFPQGDGAYIIGLDFKESGVWVSNQYSLPLELSAAKSPLPGVFSGRIVISGVNSVTHVRARMRCIKRTATNTSLIISDLVVTLEQLNK